MTTASPIKMHSVASQELQRALYNTPVTVSRRLLFRDFVSSDINKLTRVAREHHKVDATADVYRPDDAQDARS